MAKYIDLLRAHQEKDMQQASPIEQTSEIDDFVLPNEDALPEQFISPLQNHEDGNLIVDEGTPNIKDIHQTDASHTATPPNGWLSKCTQHTLDFFQHAQQKSPTSINALSSCIEELLSSLQNGSEQNIIDALELNIAQRVQQIRHIHEDLGSLVQKSIMMMLYTIKVGRRLKLRDNELHEHILAAMLHHIGMAQISSELRHKKERLSQSEFETIRQAPQYGETFLKECGITNSCILQAVAESSERYDGSGPKGLSGSEIPWSARLTGVISMFEALIHYRPYRTRLLPRDAIREIVKNHKKSFDPDMLKALIESISLYPIGTYVELNTGEIGLVVRVHPRLPLRPVVDVRMDTQGNPIPPRQVDLKERPNIVVEKCMYEEALEHLGEDKN
jgi:response regulator RpfG family c-di-GMP phosphodiesterase